MPCRLDLLQPVTILGALVRHIFRIVSWCCKPGQPQRIISGLKETSIQSYTADRMNKGEIRQEEQSEKAESCQENLGKEIHFKGP